VTSGPIYAAEDEEWLELTPLEVQQTRNDPSEEEEAPVRPGSRDVDSPPLADPRTNASGRSEPRAPARSLVTARPRSGQPALLGRARALLTDKLVAEERQCDAQLGRLRVRGMSRSVVLAVSSIKGGIGKTTIARALADAFQDGLRQNTLLADLDLEWGTAVATAPAESHRESSILDVYIDATRSARSGI
jgi:Mrp family chromosome partitioning ATPase